MTILALDRVSLGVTDLAAARTDYAALLGCAPEGARFRLGNMALDLVEAPAAGLSQVCFAVADIAKTERLLAQRALAPQRQGGDLALPTGRTHGTPIGLTAMPTARAANAPPGGMTGLDHLVVGTPDQERAIVLYAGRLGLDLRLDRTNPDWGVRLLFFRCGDLVVEVAHRLGSAEADGPDRFYGFS